MSVSVTPPKTSVGRITIDLPEEDYMGLKIAAAEGGRSSTISGIVRRLVRDYLNAREDAADIALVAERKKIGLSPVSDEEARQILATSGFEW